MQSVLLFKDIFLFSLSQVHRIIKFMNILILALALLLLAGVDAHIGV